MATYHGLAPPAVVIVNRPQNAIFAGAQTKPSLSYTYCASMSRLPNILQLTATERLRSSADRSAHEHTELF